MVSSELSYQAEEEYDGRTQEPPKVPTKQHVATLATRRLGAVSPRSEQQDSHSGQLPPLSPTTERADLITLLPQRLNIKKKSDMPTIETRIGMTDPLPAAAVVDALRSPTRTTPGARRDSGVPKNLPTSPISPLSPNAEMGFKGSPLSPSLPLKDLRKIHSPLEEDIVGIESAQKVSFLQSAKKADFVALSPSSSHACFVFTRQLQICPLLAGMNLSKTTEMRTILSLGKGDGKLIAAALSDECLVAMSENQVP